MTRIASSSVHIQTSAHSIPSVPNWFGEVAVVAHASICTWLCSRRLKSECASPGSREAITTSLTDVGCHQWRTHVGGILRASASFCQRIHGAVRTRLLARSLDALPLSRLALDQAPSRHCARCVADRPACSAGCEKEEKAGGLWDRQGIHWQVFDIDGTRQAARQRALPCTPDLPPAQRRLDPGLSLLAISDASVVKPSEPGPPCGRIIRTLDRHVFRGIGSRQ